jgi:hypothetical protein
MRMSQTDCVGSAVAPMWAFAMLHQGGLPQRDFCESGACHPTVGPAPEPQLGAGQTHL